MDLAPHGEVPLCKNNVATSIKMPIPNYPSINVYVSAQVQVKKFVYSNYETSIRVF